RRHDGLERSRDGVGVDSDTPQPAVADLKLHVRRRLGVAAFGHRVLHVVVQRYLDATCGQQREEGVYRTVAGRLRPFDAVTVAQLHAKRDGSRLVLGRRRGLHFETAPLLRLVVARQVLVAEDLPEVLARDLAALGIRRRLHDTRELDLKLAWQVERVVGLE